WPQEIQKPLPDKASFITEFRKTLHTDNSILRHYTYTEKETEITLDSKGNAKKTETNIYQVINGAEDWQTYRRQILKKGAPLTEKELEKQDREEQERVEKETRKRANQSEAKRQQEKNKEDREEREAIDDVFAMFDFQMVQREPFEGVSSILLTFDPKPNY